MEGVAGREEMQETYTVLALEVKEALYELWLFSDFCVQCNELNLF